MEWCSSAERTAVAALPALPASPSRKAGGIGAGTDNVQALARVPAMIMVGIRTDSVLLVRDVFTIRVVDTPFAAW